MGYPIQMQCACGETIHGTKYTWDGEPGHDWDTACECGNPVCEDCLEICECGDTVCRECKRFHKCEGVEHE